MRAAGAFGWAGFPFGIGIPLVGVPAPGEIGLAGAPFGCRPPDRPFALGVGEPPVMVPCVVGGVMPSK